MAHKIHRLSRSQNELEPLTFASFTQMRQYYLATVHDRDRDLAPVVAFISLEFCPRCHFEAVITSAPHTYYCQRCQSTWTLTQLRLVRVPIGRVLSHEVPF
jgi:hypothetical protein